MIAERVEAMRRVDWWPFTRITITAAVLGSTAHLVLGWQPPIRQLLAMPGQILGVLSLMAMLSFALADLYLLVFLIPLLIVGILNDWFYDLSNWTFRTAFQIRSSRALAFLGLLGEIVLFAATLYLIRRLLS